MKNTLRLFSAAVDLAAIDPGIGGGGAAAERPGFMARFQAMTASNTGLMTKVAAHETTIAAHVATIAERDGRVTALETESATLKQQALEADGALQSAADENVALGKKVAALEASEKDLDKRAAEKAKELVRASGIAATVLPGSVPVAAGGKEEPDASATPGARLLAASQAAFTKLGGKN